jgi:high-affinity iron transporter
MQIDLLPSSAIVWDTSLLISEQGEVGQLLSALFGYDATPTIAQLVIYLLAITLPLIYVNYQKTLRSVKALCQ